MTDYEKLAAEAVGNWQRFESFGWHDCPDDAEEWTIVYDNNRDADALTRANAEAIAERMKPFLGWWKDGEDAQRENHGHWAVGWVSGYAIRVYGKDGKPTAAFREWCDIQAELEEYPVLDEEIFSRVEMEDADQCWEAFARRDFYREVLRYAPWLEKEMDRADAADLRELYRAMVEHWAKRPEYESDGEGARFFVEDACASVPAWSLVRKALVKFRQGRREGRPFYWTGSKLQQSEVTNA